MKMDLPPNVWFHRQPHLMIFRPRGILDEECIDQIVYLVEKEEDRAEKRFNRFTDLEKLDAIDLNFQYVFRVALHRRLVYAKRPPIKSAFYVTSPAAVRIVRIHALITGHSPIRAAMFKNVADAAKWLDVKEKILEV